MFTTENTLTTCEDIITVEELMDILHISRNGAYSLLRRNKIACFKIGNIYKIPKQSVIEYLNNAVKPK